MKQIWIIKNNVKDIENINNLIYNLDILDIHIFDFEKYSRKKNPSCIFYF